MAAATSVLSISHSSTEQYPFTTDVTSIDKLSRVPGANNWEREGGGREGGGRKGREGGGGRERHHFNNMVGGKTLLL